MDGDANALATPAAPVCLAAGPRVTGGAALSAAPPALAVQGIKATAGPPSTIDRLLQTGVDVDRLLRAISALGDARDTVELELLRAVGSAFLRHPADWCEGFVDGFAAAVWGLVWGPLQIMGKTLLWLAKAAGCVALEAIEEDLRALPVDAANAAMCEPLHDIASVLGGADDLWSNVLSPALRQARDDPLAFLDAMLVMATLAIDAIVIALPVVGDALRDQLTGDPRRSGKIVGAVVANVVVLVGLPEVAPSEASLALTSGGATVSSELAETGAALQQIGTVGLRLAALPEAAEEAAVAKSALELMNDPNTPFSLIRQMAARGVSARRYDLAKDVEVVRAALKTTPALSRVAADLDAAVARLAIQLQYLTGTYDGLLSVARRFNSGAKLALLVKLSAFGERLSAIEEACASLDQAETVVDRAHIVDGKLFAPFAEEWARIGINSKGEMPAILVFSAQHNRSYLKFYADVLHEPLTQASSPATTRITTVFDAAIKILKPHESPPAGGDGRIYVVPGTTKLADVLVEVDALWKTSFPEIWAKAHPQIMDLIERLHAVGPR